MKTEKSTRVKQMEKILSKNLFVLLITTLTCDTVFTAFNSAAIAKTTQEVKWGTVLKTDIFMTMKESGIFETLPAATNTADFTELRKGQNFCTFFAPREGAFGKLKDGAAEELFKPKNREPWWTC